MSDQNISLDEARYLSKKYYNYEQAVKLMLNSIYGAFGNQWFYFHNKDIAETITLQSQDAILYTERLVNDYFFKIWPKDVKIHKKLGIEVTGEIKLPCGIYIDTDSCDKDTLIRTDKGNFSIEELFNRSIQLGLNDTGNTLSGHESIDTDLQVLNWTKEKGIHYVPVNRLIRHKVNKKKWKLRTKSGKEIIVTNDHSLIVFRAGKQIEVKPEQILKTDKILTVS